MRIALTGSTGFVGSSLLSSRHLAAHDLVPSGGRQSLDLRDRTLVEKWLSDIRPDVVVHAAGIVGGIQANINNNALALTENTQIGFSVLQAAKEQGVPWVINLGSSCMYPRDRDDLLRETDLLGGPLEPTNEGYALAKLAVLRLGEYLTAESRHAFRVSTLIPCNLYGPFDTFAPDRSHLVASALRKAYEKSSLDRDIVIWGDGSARREFMYADDLAYSLARALELGERLPPVVNVGTGSDRAVIDYYRAACEVVGVPADFTFDASAPTGMRRKVMDVSSAESLGLLHHTPLQVGLKVTYEWWVREGHKL